eukprot:1297698-Prymnesium_polylepis.1
MEVAITTIDGASRRSPISPERALSAVRARCAVRARSGAQPGGERVPTESLGSRRPACGASGRDLP